MNTDTPATSAADSPAAAPPAAMPEATPEAMPSHLPLGVLMPSPTNPRKRFDTAALEELAATVQVHGVMQPLLVRPNPAHQQGDGRHPYEIVAGERRWRACRLLTDQERAYPHPGQVPVIVRQLADGEVLALQALENIQRQDLNALEEADHYWLMTTHPRDAIPVEQVAAMIGKSAAYVYGRLGLRRLVEPAREALLAGKLDVSKALKVAAMPTAQQAEIVAHITTWGGEPMGTRAAERYIHDHYTLQLQSAPWNLADAALVEAAGACTDCPKRSTVQPSLFADVTDGDRCLDAACWAGKRQAMRDWRLATAQAEGYRVLRLSDPAAVLLGKGGALVDGWHDLAARVPAHLGDSSLTVEQVMDQADVPAEDITALEHPGRDTPLYAVPTAILTAALRRLPARESVADLPGERGKPALPNAEHRPKPAAEAKAPAPAKPEATPAAPAAPEWNPLDDLLAFAVLPAATKVQPEAVEMFRQRAIVRVASGLVAQRAAGEVRHRGAGMGALLPKPLQGLLVSHLAQAWRTSTAGDDTTLADAARLAGVASTPPAMGTKDICCWALQLRPDDASALAWALLALTCDAELPLPGTTWRAAVASAAGLTPAPIEALATQTVDERLRVELMVNSTIGKASRPAKPAAKPATKKTAAKKAATSKASRPAVKYRNAATGDTWTGRGLRPAWLRNAIAGGAALDDFLIDATTPVRARADQGPQA